MKAVPITNVALQSRGRNSALASISCEWEGARYHVWVFRMDRVTIEKGTGKGFPTLYKNPPLHLKTGERGHFRTRYLDASAKANRPLVDAMFAAVRDGKLWDKLAADEAAAEAKQRADHAAAVRAAAIREAAPALYEGLLVVEHETRRGGQWTLAEVNEHVRAVLEAAGLEIPDRLEGLTPAEA